MEESNVKRKTKQKKLTLSQTQSEVVIGCQKDYFEDDNNFIDYFIEVGVKPEIFRNKILYDLDNIDEINQNLIPQIISKFPNFDKKTVVIENTMIHQIFPQGFKLLESDKKPLPVFYCLILDNQLYSAIYPRKYLACLVIYESIEEYKKLYDKYQSEDEKFLSIMKNVINNDTQNDINDKNDKNKLKYKNFYIPKCLCIVSVHPYIDKYEEILKTIYNLTTDHKFSYIFIDQIVEKLIIETPKIPRGLKRIILKFPNNEIELTENKMNEFPSVNVNLAYTFDIMNYNNVIEIYKYLLYETKLIFFSENLYKLTNTILSFLFLLTPFNYQFQIVSILSKELYNFIETISPFIFGINEKYEENFFSKHKITIEDTTICVVDIDKDSYFLIAPGGELNAKDFPEMPKRLRKKIEDKIKGFLVHKKKKKSIDGYFISNKINKTCSTIKSLIESDIQRSSTYKNQNIDNMLANINIDFFNSTNANINDKNYVNLDDIYNSENKEIQKIFSKFMINLLKDYPKFLTKDYSVNRDISQSIKDMIDLKSYLNLYSNGDRLFYAKIFSTQMFMEFIYKRMMPKDCNEKVEVLFIEEKINEKINEKNLFSKINKSKNSNQYVLLNCKDYDFDNEIITIDLTAENGTPNKLKNYILNNKNLLNSFLKRGYNIKIDENKKELSFTYNIFPSLLSDKLFILNSKEYKENHERENFQFYKNIEAINTKIVNKSSLRSVQEKNNQLKNSESQNDLYLCYLILWAMGFWYIEDEEEKNARFLEMIIILGKVEEHDIKIFEVLFKTLVDYSTDENVILLYKKFIDLRLNPSWDMFTLVSKIIKKKQNIKKKNKLLHQETNMAKLKELFNRENKTNPSYKFPRRSFKIQNKDDFIFSNKVLFYAYFICKKCNGIINLGKFCTDLKSLKMEKIDNDKEAIKCNHKTKEGKICDNLCEQNFKFRFGEELFNQKITINQNFRYFTSIPNSINLKSPTELKNYLLKIATNIKNEDKFDIENFRFIYPDLFWSLIWYFDLNNIDKTFMLPYENIVKNIDSKAKNNNIKYVYNKNDLNDINKKNDGKIVYKINAKNNKKINIFKNKKEITKYKTEDLCIQNVFELTILENIGILSYKNLYLYKNNLSYNEMPLLPSEKDNYSISGSSYFYFNDSESTNLTSQMRDSSLSHQILKRNTLVPPIIKGSNLSKSGPGLFDNKFNLGTRDSISTKVIVFEESDDSLEEGE